MRGAVLALAVLVGGPIGAAGSEVSAKDSLATALPAPEAEPAADSLGSAAARPPLDLLPRLDFPRKNPAELDRARQILTESLASCGLDPRALPFEYRSGRAALAGVLWLAAAALLAWACIARSGKALAAAAAVAAAGFLGLSGKFDFFLPATAGTNIEVVLEPRGAVHREVLLGAHYDSKTEILDHVERGLLFAAIAWAAAVALFVAGSRRRAARILCGGVALGLGLAGANLASGLWLGPRGHGMVDDAAACALLVDEACRLHEQPLATTRVRCVWWAAEERGAQGSRAFARATALRPAAVVNLECLGAGPRLGVAGLEWTGSRLVPPDLQLVAALERAAPASLPLLPAPAVTDAGVWRALHVPAVTLLGLGPSGFPARHLHRPADRLEAVQLQSVEAVRSLLDGWLVRLDSE